MNAQFYNKKHKNKKKRVYRFRPSSTVDTFLSFLLHDFCEQRLKTNCQDWQIRNQKQSSNQDITFKHANLNRRLVSPFPIPSPPHPPPPFQHGWFPRPCGSAGFVGRDNYSPFHKQ
jgi:hypothetical protein